MGASVFMNVTPTRAARRRAAKLAAAVEKMTDADAAFFRRRPDREFRVRLASAAEVETAGAVLDACTAPRSGARFIMLVRRLAPDVRLRVLSQAHDWMAGDLDSVGEEDARRAFRWVTRPGTDGHRVEAKAVATLQAAGLLS